MKRATKSKKAQRGKQKEGSAFRPRPPLLLLASRPASLSVTLAAFLRPKGTLRSPQGRRRVAPRAAAQKAHHVPHLHLAYLQTRAGWKEGGARRGQCADCGARGAPRRERLMCPFSWSLAKIAAQPASGGADASKATCAQAPALLRLRAAFLPSAAPPHATLAPQRPLAPSRALRRQRGEMWRPSGARSAPVAPARGDGGPAARRSCCAAVASRTFGNACAQCCAENDASAGTPHTLPACEPRPSRQCSLATSCARKARQSSPDCSATAAWRSGRQRGVAPRARARPRHTRGGLATALILRACDCAPSAPPGGEE